MKTEAEAIGRWNSVVTFIREFRRTGLLVADALESARRPAGVRRLMRRLAWQCGLEPHQGV